MNETANTFAGLRFVREFLQMEGVEELLGKLDHLTKRGMNTAQRKAVRAGTTPFMRILRQQIPKGPTGNLRKGLKRKIRKLPILGGSYTASVYVRAPHVHLVAYGTEERFPKFKKVMSNIKRPNVKRAVVFGTKTKPMPANPFIQRVWGQMKGTVQTKTIKTFGVEVEAEAQKTAQRRARKR